MSRPDALATDHPRARSAAMLGAAWGLVGVLALLGQAVARLAPVALAPLQGQPRMTLVEAALYVASLLFNGYAAGYRAFHRSFAPRVAGRLVQLVAEPRPGRLLLAPLFCLSLVHAPRARLLAGWGLLAGLACVVVATHAIPQPYRGILDAGVVLALLWGIVTTAARAGVALLRL